jgi:hypothetical protein
MHSSPSLIPAELHHDLALDAGDENTAMLE